LTTSDAINPKYYQFSNGVQLIDITENLNGNGAQAVQYVTRSTRLDGNNKGDVLEDLNKAKWFIDREIRRATEANEQVGKAVDKAINAVMDQIFEGFGLVLPEDPLVLGPRVFTSLHEIGDAEVVDREGDHWKWIDGQLHADYQGDHDWYLACTTIRGIDDDSAEFGPFTEYIEEQPF
jgi:hypothetical protein